MRTMIAALLSLLATPALAQTTLVAEPPPRLPLTLSLDIHQQWHLDRSYRLFGSDRNDAQGGLSAALEVRRLGRLALDLGAGIHWNDDVSRWDGGNEAKRDSVAPSLSAVLRWPVHRWFEPHLRVAGDLTRSQLRLTMTDGGVLEDSHWSPGASAGAGFRLRTSPIRTSLGGGNVGFAAALIVEGGMHVGPPVSYDLSRQTPGDGKLAADRIPAASVPVGDLGRTEPYLRISFALLL